MTGLIPLSRPNRFLFTLFVPLWVSLSLSVYLYFLQPPPTLISFKRLILASAIGLIGALCVLAPLLLSAARARLTVTYLRTMLVSALGVCLVLWIALPFPNNYLLAPVIRLQVTVNAAAGSPAVEVTWLHNGLGDIPFSAVTLAPGNAAGLHILPGSRLQLTLDASGAGAFTWRGRVWREMKLVLRSDTAAQVTVAAGNQLRQYKIDPGANRELNITLPLRTQPYEVLLNLLTLIASLVSVFALLVAAYLVITQVDLLWALHRLEDLLPFAPSATWVARVGLPVFGLLAAYMIWIGFSNRMYADDFWYAATFRDLGFINAVEHFFIQVNGRFMSHIVDFGILFLGKSSTLLGPLVVLAGLGASQGFSFYHLLDGSRSMRLKTALSFTLVVMVTLLLLQPNLYEAVYWTLHALILTGGLGLTTMAIGIFLWRDMQRIGPAPAGLKREVLDSIGLLFLGFTAAGFNEAISLFALTLAGSILLVTLLRWAIYRGRPNRDARRPLSQIVPLLEFTLSVAFGLALVVFAPGNLHRASEIGVNLSPVNIIATFLDTVRKNYALVFLAHHGLRLLLFGALCLLGFIIGWIHPRLLRFQNLHPNLFERFLLVMAPFLLTLPSFLPASALGGYFPERTLFIPLYILSTFSFVAALYLGSALARRSPAAPTRLLAWVALLVILAMGVGGLVYLTGFNRQMTLFAAEWDAREVKIQQALTAGANHIAVRPYKYTFGTDLSPDRNNWLYEKLRDYYRIDITLEK